MMGKAHAGQDGETGAHAPQAGAGGVSPRDPASAAVGAAIADGLRRLLSGEEAAAGCETDGVHRMRGAARALRGELSAFGDLIDPGVAEGLADELQWLGATLGEVRDLHVLQARLKQDSEGFAEDLAPLFAALDRRHESACRALQEALQGERYRAIVARLDALARDPAPTVEAAEPCRTALPARAALAWKKLRKLGRDLDEGEPDEAYHEVRKRAKRARFVAEAIAPALGPSASKSAARFARLARRVQDVLGAHQDAVIARDTVAKVAAEHPHDGPFNLAAGRLLERLDREARESRDAFPASWAKLDRKANRRWLKP